MRWKRIALWAAGTMIVILLILIWTRPTGHRAVNAEDTQELPVMSQFSPDQQRNSYAGYLARIENAAFPQRIITLDASEYAHIEGGSFEKLDQFEGQSGVSLKTGEQGRVDWEIDVPETGFYHIAVLYYPIHGKSASIERALLIDGAIPFEEAEHLQFDRVWTNKEPEIMRDNRGNDLRPRQGEKPEWRETLLQDANGYYAEPFRFYFTEGRHSLSFISQREPMVIRRLKLFNAELPGTYEEVLERYRAEGLQAARDQLITIQGEDASAKSSPTLYPLADRSSSAVTPYSPKLIRVNTIGGYNWRLPGQWIEWEVDVPETGLYKIAVKVRQDFVRGIYSTRRLLINGEVPFREAERLPFRFKSGYRVETIGGEEPYLFKLHKGKNIIRMEDTLGEFAPLIRQVKDSLFNLNAMYRKIVMITGTSPDSYRDYRLEPNFNADSNVSGGKRATESRQQTVAQIVGR